MGLPYSYTTEYDAAVASTLADDSRQIFVNQPAKGYDSDFAPFMKKMFSGMPVAGVINQEKRGPNVGYKPYWYAYNFAVGWMSTQKDMNQQQSSHEDWDYGLGGGSGKGLWGGGKLSMMKDAVLGAGDFIVKDSDSDDATTAAPKKVCFPNMGPTCELGRRTKDYSYEELETIRKRTLECDWCSEKSKPVGLVCSVDSTGTVYQEVELCVMEKMNCLNGTAYIQDWRYNVFSTYPFLMQPRWARISIKGRYDANIRFYDRYPYGWGPTSYWLILYGWPKIGPYSALFRDYKGKGQFDWWQWYRDAINIYEYTEYTVVWNPQDGWFLMSKARYEDWRSKLYLEYYDPRPRDMKYIDVSAGWSEVWVDFMLHDLTMLYAGHCQYRPPKNDTYPSDSDAVVKRSEDAEAGYKLRQSVLKAKGVSPQDWDAEDGSYIAY